MNRTKALSQIEDEIKLCRICRRDKIGKAVAGEGNPGAEIVFIGEAPGKTEAETGRPFVGRSGRFLRAAIREILKLDDEKDVYITSPVKYLPRHGTPTKSEIAHGRRHLAKQLEVIDPEVIVMMGSVAALGVLGEKLPVDKLRGKAFKRNGKIYFLTSHPAYAIRFNRPGFRNDFKKLKRLL